MKPISNICQVVIDRPYYSLNINYRDNDKDDLAVIKEMFTQNVYRFDTNKLRQDNPVVLDIGANIGTFTLLVLKSAQEMGIAVTVYAVEPEKNNLKLLRQNISNNQRLLNDGSRVVIVEKAISDYIGQSHITNQSGSSRLTSNEYGLQGVRVITLRELMDDNDIDLVDFTKIDIEGSEVGLITGLDKTNLLRSHFYAIEFDKRNNREQFHDVIDPFLDNCSIETWGVPNNGCNIYIENHDWGRS